MGAATFTLIASPQAPSRSVERLNTGASVQTRSGVALPFRAPCSHNDQDLRQVSCSCREGYSGDGIQTCKLLDPCSQVRPSYPSTFVERRALRPETVLLTPRMAPGPPLPLVLVELNSRNKTVRGGQGL